jgi:hypothetical protein
MVVVYDSGNPSLPCQCLHVSAEHIQAITGSVAQAAGKARIRDGIMPYSSPFASRLLAILES